MSEKRLATDVLLTLEEKLNSLLSFMKNIDNNLKILIDRENKVLAAIDKKEEQIKPTKDPIISKQVSSGERKFMDIPVDQLSKKRVPRTKKNENSVAVFQVLKYPNGTEAGFVTVDIWDESGQNMIASAKTNTSGKWTKVLDPGKYFVKAYKKSTGKDKPAIDYKFYIDVEKQSDGPLELEAPTMVINQ